MKPLVTVLIVSIAAISLSACTERKLYESGQSLRLDDCRTHVDPETRQACEARARESYEVYDAKRREDAGKP